MDLGRARLRKVGVNNLHGAVHPRHGLVWTDGKCIYLAPLQVEGHQLQNASSVKLGEFEQVSSVSWSNVASADSCHMCVVHQHNVTVWRVSGTSPRLSFKQVRKINVKPIPQGCLWNPCSDVLCLLSKQQCSFYFRHDVNKGSYALPALESDSIACGCWSLDGTRLVLCVGVTLLMYRWSDVNAAVDDFSAASWRIPSLDGRLTSITPVLKDLLVVSAEIPLESLCKQQDMFHMPDSHGDGQLHSGDVIRPAKSASVTESLLNLQRDTQALTDASSSLTVIQLQNEHSEPLKLATVPLKGVLTPDILMFERHSHCVVVGSNSQSQLHIFALLEQNLAYCGNIQLDKDERPKGLSCMPTVFDESEAALLILVGQRGAEDTGFLSPSTESDFKLSLKYIILRAGREKGKSASHVKSSGLIKSEKTKTRHVKQLSDTHVQEWNNNIKRDHAVLSHTRSDEVGVKSSKPPTEEIHSGNEELFLKPPGEITHQKMIEELSGSPAHPGDLEVDTVQFSAHTPTFSNTKLAATYQLDPGTKSCDETDSPVNNLPQNIQVNGDTENSGQSPRSPRQIRTQSTIGKYSYTEQELGQTQESSSRDAGLNDHPSLINSCNMSQQSGGQHNVDMLSVTTFAPQTECESPPHGQPSNILENTSTSCTRESQHHMVNSFHDEPLKATSASSQHSSLDLISSNVFERTSRSSQTEFVEYPTLTKCDSTAQTEFFPEHDHILHKDAPKMKTDSLGQVTGNTVHSVSSSTQCEGAVMGVRAADFLAERPDLQESPRSHDLEHARHDALSDLGLGSSHHSLDCSWDTLERQVKSQKESIDALHQRLESLAKAVDKTMCIFPIKYQELSTPEMVEISCERPEGKVTKKFLLDSGRLQLEPVKLTFGLATVELWLDGISCVLGSNIDGYIPLKFTPSTKLHISGQAQDGLHQS